MTSIMSFNKETTKEYCSDYKENKEIKRFVEMIAWSSPGKHILDGKVMKKGDKLKMLIKLCGYFGPMIDLIIRGCIPYLMIMHFQDHTITFTANNGVISSFLKSNFKDDALLMTIDRWLNNPSLRKDFDTTYRNTRHEYLTTQLETLTMQPYIRVSISKII